MEGNFSRPHRVRDGPAGRHARRLGGNHDSLCDSAEEGWDVDGFGVTRNAQSVSIQGRWHGWQALVPAGRLSVVEGQIILSQAYGNASKDKNQQQTEHRCGVLKFAKLLRFYT